MEHTILFEGSETFQVPCSVVDEHLSKAPEGALKLLLFLLRHGTGSFHLDDLKNALSLSEDEIESHFSFWMKVGVLFFAGGRYYIERPKVSTADLMRYSASSVSSRLQQDEGLRFLYARAEETLKKPLTAEDSSVILSMTDWLGLPAEVVALLVEYYGSEGKSLKTMHKIAAEWAEKGIVDYEQAEKEIERANAAKQAAAKIAKLIGISGRAPTPTEKKLFEKWKDTDLSLISAAYERSVRNTGKYSHNYMDTVLESWKKEGILKADQIPTEEKPKKKTRKSTPAKVKIDKDAVSALEWQILFGDGQE